MRGTELTPCLRISSGDATGAETGGCPPYTPCTPPVHPLCIRIEIFARNRRPDGRPRRF